MYQKSTPAEISKRIVMKQSRLEEIELEITELLIELNEISPTSPKQNESHYDRLVTKHIKQLKSYNELKDLAMQLISMIADQRQVRLSAIMEEIGICDDS